MRENVIETIKKEKLIAIVRGIAPEKCLKVAGALYAGGFRLVEITFDQKNPDSWATTAPRSRPSARRTAELWRSARAQ